MSGVLYWLGVLIALGSAVAFAVLGLLPLYGGARTTSEQLIPGFKPDRPGPAERALALVAVWVPVAIVCGFGLYAAVQILGVAIRAF